MVNFIASSFTFVILTLAAVKAQGPIVASNYPPTNTVPDVNSPQVQAWIKELGDLSGAPNIPVAPFNVQPPACDHPVANECHWTCDGCSGDDITACGTPNTWGLTFDDGPTAATPPLLDYLKAQKLSATFFVIGSQVVQYPDTLKRELSDGHHLASHTWSHHALTTLTNEQIIAEMKWTEKAVLDATGLKLKYMRPPYGDINNRVRFILKKMGYIPVDWTGDAFDTTDWKISASFSEANAVTHFSSSIKNYTASAKTKGFYCLEHDLSTATVAAAQKFIPLGQAAKLSFGNVATCENDAQPYQLGGTAPMPTVSGITPANGGSGASPTGAGSPGPTVAGKSSDASTATKTTGLLTAAAAAFVGAVLA